MYIDAHSHLDKYGDEIEDVLNQIKSNKIFTISNSMDISAYQKNLEIASRTNLVIPTFGIHPWNASEFLDSKVNFENCILQTPIIGEIGLDFFFIKDAAQYPSQIGLFEFFLQKASEQKKIIIVHTKGAENEVLKFLLAHKISSAIIHWYSGPIDILKKYLECDNFYFTINLELLYSKHIQAIAKQIPNGKLLTELDNPGGVTGKIGMPNMIMDVVKKLSEIKKIGTTEMRTLIKSNLADLFKDNLWLKKQNEIIENLCL